MTNFLEFTTLGIAMAAVYAIAASGLVVTYTTSGIFNFAHGAFGTLAAFTFWQLSAPGEMGGWGINRGVAFVLAVFVIAPLIGAVVERVIMRGLEGTTEVVRIVVTVSLLLAVVGIVNWIWPGDVTRSFPRFFGNGGITLGEQKIVYHRILILVAAIVVAGVLRLVLYKSRMGIAMRAVVDDRSLVRLNGGSPTRISMFAWALGSSLAALSGILNAPLQGLNSVNLTLTVVNCYAAAVVGKLRSLPMTFLGALILGLAESYYAWLVASRWPEVGGFMTSGVQFGLPAIMLLIVMLLQPQERLRAGGIQRTRSVQRVPTMRMAALGGACIVLGSVAVATLIERDSDRLPIVWALFYALVSLSLVPLTGYAGNISLAQMSFVGIGALVMSKVASTTTSVGALIVALVVCAVVGAIVALPALRLTGIYLALSTAAFSLLMSKVVFSQSKLAPGSNIRVEPLDLGFWKPISNLDRIILYSVMFALVGVGIVALRRSSYGRRLVAMKDSPVACATLGLNLTTTKIGVFTLSSSIAGLAGALAGRAVPAPELELVSSMSVTMLAVVGGVGAVGGALMGGAMLGGFQNLLPSLLRGNVVGLFQYFNMDVTNVLNVAPGFMGISLGRNPDGAVAQIGDAYRAVLDKKGSLGLALAGPAAFWVLAYTDTITGWGFVGMLVVFSFAVLPLLPILLEPIEGGRALPAGIVLIVGVAAAGAVNWGETFSSNGLIIVLQLLAAVVVAGIAGAVHGKLPSPVSEVTMPSPDLVGIDRPLTRADALEAERMLGLSEADIHGAA